ncbi:MAG: single-stranded-DNA-specific exonuclease RecJ [Gemmataceae bacterium]
MPHAESVRIAAALGVSEMLGHLLWHRGVRDVAQARRFLSPALSELPEPESLPGLPQAVEVLLEAIRSGAPICIYGDYDVDGIVATTILWRCLRLHGARVSYYIPHRVEEGYGLNAEALRTIKAQGAPVVVTVDCGINSLAEARLARQLGLTLVVTDHHQRGDTLPEAAAIVHPQAAPASADRSSCFDELCGAGIAFQLAWGLTRRLVSRARAHEAARRLLLEAVGLVALATVADVVPLVGANRILVRHGLEQLRNMPSPGLRALLQVARPSDRSTLDVDDLAFVLAPRLNAAGRLDAAHSAVELLLCPNEEKALPLAQKLQTLNEQRQCLELDTLEKARKVAEQQHDVHRDPALVLTGDWHPGIMGLVAARLAESLGKPTLLISLHDDPAQGSGRSVEGFALHEALAACRHLLVDYGGHAKAAGLRVSHRHIEALRRAFCAYAAQRLRSNQSARLVIDAEIPLSALTPSVLDELERLAPHGVGNRPPLFLAGDVHLIGPPQIFGTNGQHIRCQVRQENGPTLWAIGFRMAERRADWQSADGRCCLAFRPRKNRYRGATSIELVVVDLHPGSPPPLRLLDEVTGHETGTRPWT